MLGGLWDLHGIDRNTEICAWTVTAMSLAPLSSRLYAETVVIVKQKLLISSMGLLNMGRFSHTQLDISSR